MDKSLTNEKEQKMEAWNREEGDKDKVSVFAGKWPPVTKERSCHEGFPIPGKWENGGAINRKGWKMKRTSGGGLLFEHVEFHVIKGINVAM